MSGCRRSPNHPSHPPRNLTRTSSEIRPSQTLNPSAPSFIPTSFEKQSSVRHKTPPHKLCSLNICHVNIRSLLAESHLIELESLCAAQNIDVLCLSETWLSPSRAKPGAILVNIPGFQPLFRRDRLHGRYGGVAVYVRNGLNAVSTNMCTDLECVKITLHLPGKEKVTVVAVYRPPNFDRSSFVSELDSILTTRNSDSYLTCVVGDFNAKLSTWWNGQSSDVRGVALSSLMYDHGLAQMVEGPTRFSSSSASQLDLIFMDNSDAVSDCLVLPPIADHCPTLLQLQLNVMSLSPQHTGPCKSWSFKLADFPGLNNFFKSVDWSSVYTTPDASAALTLWENILVSSMEQFIPFRTYGAPRPHSKPWFNSFLNRLRRKRNRLFSQSKLLDRNHPLSAAYRKVRNHYVAQLRSAARQYYAKQVSALQSARLVNDPHRWWRTAKAACGINSVDSIPPLLNNDCMKVPAEEKAACLNSVFAKQCNQSLLLTFDQYYSWKFLLLTQRISFSYKKIIDTQHLEGLWQRWDS